VKIHISCLVDRDPKFVIQAYNWLVSIHSTNTKATPFVCAVDGALSAQQVRTFESLGAKVVAAERFGEGRAAYCNKISQLFIDDVIDCDFLILSDADLGFLAPPEQAINGDPLRARPVDAPNPTVTNIEKWLEAIETPGFGDAEAQFSPRLGRPQKPTAALKHAVKQLLQPKQQDKVQRRTLAHNYNGGLYVIRRDEIQRLREAWYNYATKLLAAAPPNAQWAKHADQVGLACAVHALGIEVSKLESGWNFPTHLSVDHYRTFTDSPKLYCLHYHGHMDSHGLPKKVGVPWLDDSLNLLRKAITGGDHAVKRSPTRRN